MLHDITSIRRGSYYRAIGYRSTVFSLSPAAGLGGEVPRYCRPYLVLDFAHPITLEIAKALQAANRGNAAELAPILRWLVASIHRCTGKNDKIVDAVGQPCRHACYDLALT